MFNYYHETMKKILTLAAMMSFALSTSIAFGQAQEELRKEVRLEDENGVKTLYITTTSNGTTVEEVYTGEQAEAKLAELMEGRKGDEGVTKEVEVTEANGEKVVTIITSTNGKMRTEVYTGADADAKLKELEATEKSQGQMKESKVEERAIDQER